MSKSKIGILSLVFKSAGINVLNNNKPIEYGDLVKIISKRFQNYNEGSVFRVDGLTHDSNGNITKVGIRPSEKGNTPPRYGVNKLRYVSIKGVIKVAGNRGNFDLDVPEEVRSAHRRRLLNHEGRVTTSGEFKWYSGYGNNFSYEHEVTSELLASYKKFVRLYKKR